jgi:hypothetical protein
MSAESVAAFAMLLTILNALMMTALVMWFHHAFAGSRELAALKQHLEQRTQRLEVDVRAMAHRIDFAEAMGQPAKKSG